MQKIKSKTFQKLSKNSKQSTVFQTLQQYTNDAVKYHKQVSKYINNKKNEIYNSDDEYSQISQSIHNFFKHRQVSTLRKQLKQALTVLLQDFIQIHKEREFYSEKELQQRHQYQYYLQLIKKIKNSDPIRIFCLYKLKQYIEEKLQFVEEVTNYQKNIPQEYPLMTKSLKQYLNIKNVNNKVSNINDQKCSIDQSEFAKNALRTIFSNIKELSKDYQRANCNKYAVIEHLIARI